MEKQKNILKSRKANNKFTGMRLNLKFIKTILIELLFVSCISINAQQTKFISDLVSKMTLEEKLGQMTLCSAGEDPTVPVANINFRNDIKKGRCGAIFAAVSPDSIKYLQDLAMQSRLRIPLLFGYDVIHGFSTLFPIPLAEAASWDLSLIEKEARISAIEASSQGINWLFGPMVDIARDPRWGRISEGAGEDPYLGSQIAIHRVRGLQGSDLSLNNTVAACVKHFAAYGAPVGGKDYNTVILSKQELNDVYLKPYKAAVNEGAASIMCSFNEINGTPSTSNRQLLTDMLMKQWNFGGFVVTDYASIMELVNHGVSENEKESAELALNAGVHMDMEAGIYIKENTKETAANKLLMKQIDEAVKRILTIKYKLGLFDDPYKYCKSTTNKLMTQDHINTAKELATKSIVLLKNNGVLPLKNDISNIALIGPLGNDKIDPMGTWIAQAKSENVVTLLTGLKNQFKNSKIVYSKGCDIDSTDTSGFSEALSIAQNSDLIILALGEKGDMAGEAASRANIGLPGVQTALLRELRKTGKPIVLVLMNGRPLVLEKEVELCDAMLEAWQLGTTTGDAIADILVGNYNPSGKLPATFPRSVGQIPIYYAAKSTGRPGDPKARYSTRYLDIPFTPLFPFGYGLSYTQFGFDDIKLSSKEINLNDKITISCEVKNTGKFKGTEVVQLYVQDIKGSVTRPVRELKGFQKVELSPGESKHVVFELSPTTDLIFTNANEVQTIEKGLFNVFIGGDSNAKLTSSFAVK